MNRTPLYVRLLFAACLLVPVLAGAYRLVNDNKPACSAANQYCELGKRLAYGPLRGAVP